MVASLSRGLSLIGIAILVVAQETFARSKAGEEEVCILEAERLLVGQVGKVFKTRRVGTVPVFTNFKGFKGYQNVLNLREVWLKKSK